MQGSQGEAWVEAVRAALVAVAVAEDAEPMRAYMKSEMPFLGVRSAARREAVGAVFRAARFADAGAWRGAARALWFGARFREERYAAIDLLQDRRHGRWLDLEAVPLLEELIVSGAWWDLVDPLCTISLGALVAREREARRRGDSASQLRLLLLLGRQGAAEGFRPPVVVHPLGRLGVGNL